PTPYMRTSHMDLLIQWREQAVRNHNRAYTAFDGKKYDISLSGTCLTQCHAAKADFCDRCHNYSGVSAYCWDCHVDARQAARSGQ
ncbi:MAG: sulfate reduction electron transfer complex DsrMKJOP subunit DsrJ, partial [Acidobacteria bacterium]|nr:sulfate reduction electron transfer complex DsrMKJOP subunit DsrJ [Acidobacteriota bacterium]